MPADIDDAISAQLDILRLSAGESARVFRALELLTRDLARRVPELTGAGKRRADALHREVSNLVAAEYQEIERFTAATRAGVADFVAESEADALQERFQGVPTPPRVVLPTDTVLASLAKDAVVQGGPAKEWWARQGRKTSERFSDAVRLGVLAGENNTQITRRVQAGMDVSMRDADALVRTSVQTVANDARMATWRGNPDLVRGVQQISTLDGRTSVTCIAYSGGRWDLDGKPMPGTRLPWNGGPPRHWRCRSTTVPVLVTFRDLGFDLDEPPPGKRASARGPVGADTTFDQWLSRRTPEQIAGQLGPGRAELWRAGKITLSDLVSGTGRPATLAQLRA